MRSLPNEISKRLSNKIQTRSNNSDPSARIWISRTETPLTDSLFLEQQDVFSSAPEVIPPSSEITDISIAVCHPRLKSDNTHAWIAYISDGKIRVVSSLLKTKMYTHVWEDVGIEIQATAVSIAFDGTMPKNVDGEVEFVTDFLPWVFYIDGGALYGRYLDGNPILLAEANCTDVSAIRAMWSSAGGFDFGMVVFFIMAGQLYYRQRINGEWMDAELISFGPSGVTWQEIAAFRTWDYRVGLQAMATDGTVYELFTQFMGVGKQNTEHIIVRDIKAESDLIGVTYHNATETEHIKLSDISAGAPFGGLYSLDMPVMLSAHNEEADDGDWGKIVTVEFNVHMNAESISENAGCFVIVDSNGSVYMAGASTLDLVTGRTITLEFTDFNAASGNCELVYSPGSVVSMAGVQMSRTGVAFVPENLNPPLIDPPEPVNVCNLDTHGTEVAIRFSDSLVGDASGNEDKFVVTTQEYDMVPEGTLSNVNKPVIRAYKYTSVESSLDLSDGTYERVVYDDGSLRLRKLTEVSEK